MTGKLFVGLSALTLFVLLTACGNSKSTTTETASAVFDTTETEESDSPESESSRYVFEGTTDFFTANGIEITRGAYNEFTHYSTTTSDEWTIIDVTYTIEITQSAPADLDDGYVQTVAVITCIDSFEGKIWTWSSVYDKYTGMALEWPVRDYSSADGRIQHTEVVVVSVNGVEYDCQVTIEDTGKFPIIITVIHPQEYDGVIFEIGGLDAEYLTVSQNIDWTKEYRLLDKTPCYEPAYFALE
ncbi:MAG: hypothetical protein LUI87_18235 [Lachnospiraceae bacterium]|nr:hypothetical protein [Lachnospiraceae bacterium]